VQQLRESVTNHGVLDAVLCHADRAPDRPAVKDLDRALTRGELRSAAGRVAAGLRQKGVEPGDRVALLIGNSVDFVVAALGCLWAGVTFVPLAITDRRHSVDLSFGIERRGWANATTSSRADRLHHLHVGDDR
jgi:D-alanine--poly(phosphoribitol) ligase subunit 1